MRSTANATEAGQPYRSGFVTIVGSPNVGKSTLMNALVGQKVAIVSDKAQTTRSRIRGVVSLPNAQIVLIDTPGIQTPNNRLGEYMLDTSYGSVADGDCILLLIDPLNGLRQRDEEILRRLEKSKIPVVAAINKIDRAAPIQVETVRKLLEQHAWITKIVEISAHTRQGLSELLDVLNGYLLPGPQYFPEDMVTDQPERVLCAEFIREACLRCLREEIPHGVAVDMEKISEREDRELLDIWATIYCEKESHKRILIGNKGSMLKKIGSMSRKQIEWLMERKVNLQLWVKVKENWRDNARELRALGYQDE